MLGEQQPEASLFDLIICLSDTVDLIDPIVANHQKQVAYIAFGIATELGMSAQQKNELVLAGALHDIGALSLNERFKLLQFEDADASRHAELGHLLIKTFPPLSGSAELVRFHHVPWQKGAGNQFHGKQVPIGSHILHLADRVAVQLNKQQGVLGQVGRVCEKIEEQSGVAFMPDLIDAFMSLAAKEYFWLDVISPTIGSILLRRIRSETVELNANELLSLAKLFSHIIDFRSPFTATHSSGVAACAESLARIVGFSEIECRTMKTAGYLHDLGKLSVPADILDKPTRLKADEFDIIKGHTYYTYRVLNTISGLSTITAWAAYHHERLDGTGYPFHLKGQEIPLGSQIMAVADVFTAITEDRPYREGMRVHDCMKVLEKMVNNSALNAGIVSLLNHHYDEINTIRKNAQISASQGYQEFRESLK